MEPLQIPAIEFDDLTPELQRALFERTRRLGYLGEFFRCTAHQPETLLAFHRFSEAAREGVPDLLVEVIALTVSCVTDNEYERNQHERLCLTLDIDEAWIREVERLAPDTADALTRTERAVQNYVLAALVDNGRRSHSELSEIVGLLGPSMAVAVVFLVARYMAHALIVHSLGLEPPVVSIFTEEATQ